MHIMLHEHDKHLDTDFALSTALNSFVFLANMSAHVRGEPCDCKRSTFQQSGFNLGDDAVLEKTHFQDK